MARTTSKKVAQAKNRVKTAPVYDPTKPYKWEPTDEFVFSGQEFGYMYNSLMVKKAELIQQLDMLTLLEAKLKKAVEDGVATEQESPKKEGAN